ncbi:MAG: hypothetical protein GF398_19835 [Chitinivibrionales bacterium]|nr:hypothetical protein [Chitinivibrionales bacterium]
MNLSQATRSCACGLFAAIILSGCAEKKQSSEMSFKDCIEIVPQKVRGLSVQGPRTESNVIKDMVPFNCKLNEWFATYASENSITKASVDLSITVDHIGEILTASIEKSTVDDPAFSKNLLKMAYSIEFSYWGEEKEGETIIRYPVRLSL